MTYALYTACACIALLILRALLVRDEKITMPTSGVGVSETASVDSYIRSGRKIQAIKLLRQESGLGLKEAKDEVERREREMQLA